MSDLPHETDLDPAPEVETALGTGRAAAVETVRPPSRRIGRMAGVVSFVYVCWYIAGLVVLEASPSAYNALNRFYGSLGFRVVLAAVLLALVFHLVDGLRVTVEDLVPGWDRHDLVLRTIARFLVPVMWIPAALVVVWPAVRGWFSW